MIYYDSKAVYGEAAMNHRQNLSRQQEHLIAAREWISDCRWREEPEDLADLTDAEVIRGIDRHCQGGWSGFCLSQDVVDLPIYSPVDLIV
jgi:hypothetical protein